jgi:hypothetical protein
MGTALGIGIGIPFTRRSGGGIDAQAQAHFDRVIADGGVIPSGLVGVNNFFTTVKGIYGTSDITTAISVGLDAQVLGYKLGAGAGTTAGQASQKLYSCSGSSGDVEQTTAASQPLLLVHSGANYWFQPPSLPANNCQTPYQASYNLTSYADIRVKVDLNINATGFPDYPFLFGWNNYNGLGVNNDGTLFFFLNSAGTAVTTATISITYSGWIRVVKNVGTYTYYTSTDGVNWNVLEVVSGSINNLNVTNQPLIIGSSSNDARSCGQVKYYRAQLYDNTNLLADFNPNTYNAATSQTQWTSTTGEVWTINTGTATTGYKGVLVYRTIVQSDGVDDRLLSLNNITVKVVYNSVTILSGNDYAGITNGGTGSGDNFWIYTEPTLKLTSGVTSTIYKNNIVSTDYIVGEKFINIVTSNSFVSNNGCAIFHLITNNYLNGAIDTIIISSITNNTTERTDIYNFLKTMNNL